MKKHLFYLVVFAMCITTSAQTTRVITGSVTDTSGKPLPGAVVAAKGSSEITTTDTDGTFSLEIPSDITKVIARHEGMAKKKLTVSDDFMIFRLMPQKKRQWFLTGNFLFYSGHDNLRSYLFGLRGGCLGKWGWYGTIYAGMSMESGSYYNDSFVCFLGSAGVTKRINNYLHAYLGLGAGNLEETTQSSLEVGLMGKIGNHFLIHVGPQIMDFDFGTGGVNIGVGYAF